MILTIGPGGSGLSFLNWSIIYLRGDDLYTLLDNKSVTVTHNPLLQDCTAHGQQKDHLQLSKELIKLHQATDQSVVFVVPSHQDDLEYTLNFTCRKIIFNSQADSEEFLARMYYTVPDLFLHELIDNLSIKYDRQIIKQVLIDCNKFFTKYYTVPTDYSNYFRINYNDIFQNLDKKIYDIFDYLELSVSQDRITNWLSVYHQYRLMNQNFLSRFLDDPVKVDSNDKIKIFKEIVQWKTGLYQHIKNN